MASNSSKPKVPSGCLLVSEVWRKTQLSEHLRRSTDVHYAEGLDVVDFYPSEDAAVIFLSEADLVSGNAYRRRIVKFRQVIGITRGVVVAQKTQLTSEHFGNLQKFVVIELGLTLIPVSSIEEAGNLLTQMVCCEAKINANPFRMKTKPANTPDAALLGCTTMIPGLGEKKALLLLKHFGSLKSLCNASQESIADIVGPSTALSVYNFFHTFS
ncbi:Fanconi anemia core complex-associated protein 24-like [Macrobrachium rosenbergii]|uniref:Fanconi anemia core complex-associated protein 24-like n=1 Tax=Macrobrachium rosenbergii TaxID=79674 RepID=UPI0034D49498